MSGGNPTFTLAIIAPGFILSNILELIIMFTVLTLPSGSIPAIHPFSELSHSITLMFGSYPSQSPPGWRVAM